MAGRSTGISRIIIERQDDVLARFGNQLGALGEGKARQAMGRALNHTGRRTFTAVKRALVKQTSIKRGVIEKAVRARAAAHKGDGALEFEIYGSGSEIPLKEFSPKQFSFGVRAKVWGRMQRFDGAFINAGTWRSGNSIAFGHVFTRTGGRSSSGKKNAIEKAFGPSIPKEMIALDETRATFTRMAKEGLEKRLAHEIARMLPG